MKGYFDSSILLSILLDQHGKEQAWKIWALIDEKSSSLLLDAEMHVVLRRYHANVNSPKAGPIFLIKEGESRAMMRTIEMIPFTSKVMEIVRSEERLTQCRSLDAIHLATALFVQRETDESLVICSYDVRMRDVARELGFTVLPK